MLSIYARLLLYNINNTSQALYNIKLANLIINYQACHPVIEHKVFPSYSYGIYLALKHTAISKKKNNTKFVQL